VKLHVLPLLLRIYGVGGDAGGGTALGMERSPASTGKATVAPTSNKFKAEARLYSSGTPVESACTH